MHVSLCESELIQMNDQEKVEKIIKVTCFGFVVVRKDTIVYKGLHFACSNKFGEKVDLSAVVGYNLFLILSNSSSTSSKVPLLQ